LELDATYAENVPLIDSVGRERGHRFRKTQMFALASLSLLAAGSAERCYEYDEAALCQLVTRYERELPLHAHVCCSQPAPGRWVEEMLVGSFRGDDDGTGRVGWYNLGRPMRMRPAPVLG